MYKKIQGGRKKHTYKRKRNVTTTNSNTDNNKHIELIIPVQKGLLRKLIPESLIETCFIGKNAVPTRIENEMNNINQSRII